MNRARVFVSTFPFAETNTIPLELLREAGCEIILNPLGRRLQDGELGGFLADIDILIAGTEKIDRDVLDKAPRLSLIARVGIGLDGVDLLECEKREIEVTYTPDAPAPAVAELTIGLILNLIRFVGLSDRHIREGTWRRFFGMRISELTIGVIGAGRIGGRVIRRLAAFGSPRLLVNDLSPNTSICPSLKLEWVDKKTIFTESDVVTLHVPLTKSTLGMVGQQEISLMKRGSFIINTCRGGVINETALLNALNDHSIEGAALDVFAQEPYEGPLRECERVLLTAHQGSMTRDCRERMELEACQEAVHFTSGLAQISPVPEAEYRLRDAN